MFFPRLAGDVEVHAQVHGGMMAGQLHAPVAPGRNMMLLKTLGLEVPARKLDRRKLFNGARRELGIGRGEVRAWYALVEDLPPEKLRALILF
jgi:hypothetical protein